MRGKSMWYNDGKGINLDRVFPATTLDGIKNGDG